MVYDTIVDVQNCAKFQQVVLTWRSGWRDTIPYADANPYIRSSRWCWHDNVQYRVAEYHNGWEFWMTKRRLEMLAYKDLGPIVLSMFHPGE
ncbi:unnamed protein product [Symbiodinium necroappetens]|uniref:Uncharacterized protein n=1 Tax=Symbiodinium necroappetens TaxID=1628268 RepID=A0A813BP93_9DINO|nr:unnamed protein product [Symbiodinium necroappetens]